MVSLKDCQSELMTIWSRQNPDERHQLLRIILFFRYFLFSDVTRQFKLIFDVRSIHS